jgi:hypothetical protein
MPFLSFLNRKVRRQNCWWVLRVQWTLGTQFCIIWHPIQMYNFFFFTFFYIFFYPQALFMLALDIKSIIFNIFYFLISSFISACFLYQVDHLQHILLSDHKLYFCLLLISSWSSSTYSTFWSQALFLLASYIRSIIFNISQCSITPQKYKLI